MIVAILAAVAIGNGGVHPDYRIEIAYFLPSGRVAAESYEKRIEAIMDLVNDVYKADLRSRGHETDGLHFAPGIKLIRGKREAAYYNHAPEFNANEQWKRILPEIAPAIGSPQKQVTVVFAETYADGPAEHLWPGVIARGAYFNSTGGLAIFSAHILRPEFAFSSSEELIKLFFNQAPLTGRKAWGHKMNSPLGTFVEDGVGAVVHELGHALGLPHDRRSDSTDLMGNGFRNLRWNFESQSAQKARFSEENARLLAASRYLAQKPSLGDNQPPKIMDSILRPSGGNFELTARVEDDGGLCALVFVDRAAGSVIGGQALRGKSATVLFSIPRKPRAAGPPQVRIIVADAGGNQARQDVESTRTR